MVKHVKVVQRCGCSYEENGQGIDQLVCERHAAEQYRAGIELVHRVPCGEDHL